jgi:hypothetical protein
VKAIEAFGDHRWGRSPLPLSGVFLARQPTFGVQGGRAACPGRVIPSSEARTRRGAGSTWSVSAIIRG